MERRSEAGQALILTTVVLIALLASAGVAVDMGANRYQKRLQQSAADAAALAGATNLPPYSGYQAAGYAAATQDGFTDNSGNQISACQAANAAVGTICVVLNNGPSTGPHAGDVKYVEALVGEVHPTYFMQILKIPSSTIIARAVATNYSGATNGSTNYNCLITLGAPSSSIEGVNINGSATLNAPTCGIADNGNYNTKGNALVVSAGTFGVSGTSNVKGPGGTVTCSSGQPTCPEDGTPAVANPLASLAAPGPPAPSSSCPKPGTDPCNVTTSGTTTLQPGEYTSITFGKNSTTTLNPGIYYIDGSAGVTFNGGGTVTGSGVMFYFTCPAGTSPCGTNGATINATGGGSNLNIQLTPPTSGTYQGILFDQDPNDTAAPSLGGTNNSNFGGILYFPKEQLTFFGNNTSYSTGMVIADAVNLSGNPTVNLVGTAGLPGGALPPLLTVGSAILVE